MYHVLTEVVRNLLQVGRHQSESFCSLEIWQMQEALVDQVLAVDLLAGPLAVGVASQAVGPMDFHVRVGLDEHEAWGSYMFGESKEVET